MAALLSRYIAEAGRQPFSWGAADCMTFAGDWVRRLTGQDPVARWRGAYADEAGAQRFITDAGGLAFLMEEGLRAVGWSRTAVPAPGDIVCANLPGHPAPLGGIACVGGKIVFRARRGLVIWPAQVLEAWRG